MRAFTFLKPFFISCSVFVFLFTGCAMLQKGDPAGYEGRGLSYEGVDFSVLEGRTVVLDPGHGGKYSGAVGQGGLTEKEVNLAVARILQGLLEGYGARVVMTRVEDVDLLPADGGSLHSDLAVRVAAADSAGSDAIFISIHHNNLGTPNSKFNQTETYYKMGDQGPSLDLARYINRQMTRSVGLPRSYIRPGNYYVLRNNRHTAVLGEASYLSHPGVEKKLSGQGARQLEAYAYLLGIVDYLSGGVPVVDSLMLEGTSPVHDPWPQLVARVYDHTTGVGVDPQRVEVELDGAVVKSDYDIRTGALRLRPDKPLANGMHRAVVRARNIRGNAATQAEMDFYVTVPPGWLRLTSSLSRAPLDGLTPLRITAVVGDLWGRPVADGTEVLFVFSDPNVPTRAVAVRGGQASLVVTPAANHDFMVEASCGDLSEKMTIPLGEGRRAVLVLRVSDGSSGRALGAVDVRLPEVGLHKTSADGYLSLEGLDSGELEIALALDGYVPRVEKVELATGRTSLVQVSLESVLDGVLHGKKIVLDPAGGLADPGVTGPDGTREADINLAVAGLLADYISRAGAEALLTRDGEDSPGAWERAWRAENHQGDLLVSISHGGRPAKQTVPPTVVHHYPGSTNGKRLAVEIASSLKGFAGRPWRGATQGYERIIQQVSCPAVWVRAASVADNSAESLLATPAGQRAEALAIFEALVRYFGGQDAPSGEIAGRVSDGRGGVIAGALVIVDGWLPAQTDLTGKFAFTSLSAGEHNIEVHYQGDCWKSGPVQSCRKLEVVLEMQ
jgi:N-acetylmuramoyl-L-alanine amidase